MSAADLFPRDEFQAEEGYLGSYRRAVERLRGETADELGAQPMPPEKLSMFAVAVASLPLIALMHPAISLEPLGWQVAVALAAVWMIAYRVQAPRYRRFQEHWHRKIAAHHAAEAVAPQQALRFL